MRTLLPLIRQQLSGSRLVWNMLFWLGHVAIFGYGWYKQATDERLAGLNSLRFSVWTSRGAGLCLGVDGLLLILPVLRNVLRYLRPLPLVGAWVDENLWAHRQAAYSMLIWTVVHVTAHYVNMLNVERTQIRKEMAWAIMYTQPGGFTGHVMLLFMLLIYSTAHKRIKTECFEAFWYTHQLVGADSVVVADWSLTDQQVNDNPQSPWAGAALLHCSRTAGCFVRGALPGQPVRCLGYESWHWTIAAGILYFIERMIRFARSRRPIELAKVMLHPAGAMELQFSHPAFHYKPGQWLFLNVPELAPWQWHPFTISSAPEDPYVSVHILSLPEKACTDTFLGLDTRAGFLEFSTTVISPAPLPRMYIDGPFGAPAQDVLKNEGIGVTPFASILKHIWYKQQRKELCALKRVRFIWLNRDTGSFEWFHTLLTQLEEAQTEPDFLRISTFLTGHMDDDTIHNITIHDLDSERDALTRLRTRTQFGRPDWGQLFEAIRLEILEGDRALPGPESCLTTKVGVYFCGPAALAKTLKAETSKIEQRCRQEACGVKFSFSKEHF
ncbi:BQ2448_1355 [Microbotryum intermedium]|uniref:BQ2448_1355 protein n=1 Tax=Microbotryum intermedium TaxID=269621 RepID=A0A238FCX3_9BASI|nr:BQ2448_1355 [Microbotryum intermedium]